MGKAVEAGGAARGGRRRRRRKRKEKEKRASGEGRQEEGKGREKKERKRRNGRQASVDLGPRELRFERPRSFQSKG
ncbi:hypothetical protein Droror1_Dr00024159 [Drosera rotundifolia]